MSHLKKCLKIIIVLLHLLVLLAKLLRSLFLNVFLVILILARINLDSKGIMAQINVYNYVLKEIIDAYRVMNGSVFTCFLDASKAFDRVNHHTLFAKLGNRGNSSIYYSHIVFLVCKPADVHTLGRDIFHLFQGF